MKNWKDRKIEALEKEIRRLQDKLYHAIERENRERDRANSLKFQNSTLERYIQDLRARIADLERRLSNER